jgi:LysM repeat protein/ABC-type branched-subunit amino acid transport system substrate-binding protein
MSLKVPVIKGRNGTVEEILEADKFLYHIVEKGQTYQNLSKTYNISEEKIKESNPGIGSKPRKGDVVRIPRPTSRITKETVMEDLSKDDKTQVSADTSQLIRHKVEKGQTLYSIAKKYNTGIEDIISLNPGVEKVLKAGQVITIPGKKSATGREEKPEKKVDKLKTGNREKATGSEENKITGSKTKDIPCGQFNYNKSPITFKVALLLPLYLKDFEHVINVDTINVKEEDKPSENEFFEKSKIFVEFYEGVLLALDTLKKEGVSFDLYVYDTEKDTNLVKNILKKQVFRTMDIIIGPVYSSCFNIVSRFAKENNINIVSPMSSRNKTISNNPRLFQVIPSQHEQIRILARCLSAYKDCRIVVLHGGRKPEKEMAQEFKKNVSEFFGQDFNPDSYKEVTVTIDESIQMGDESNRKIIALIKKNLSVTSGNLVVIPSSDAALVTELINQLNNINTEEDNPFNITACGFPNWQKFDNIEIEYLHDLQLITVSSNYIDYNLPEVRKFVIKYRDTFSTEPTQYSFQGYDIGMFFLTALKKYGKDFGQCLNEPGYAEKGLQNDFCFKSRSKTGGFENHFISVVQYTRDLNVVRIN